MINADGKPGVVIAGSALFLAIIERFPLVVWAGGALLGWIAGGLLPEDPAIAQYLSNSEVSLGGIEVEPITVICGILGAIFVVLMGLHLARSNRMRMAQSGQQAE